ncbi:MAG: hypothetical protein ACLPWS_07950 [Rhodomicrobium sp.]
MICDPGRDENTKPLEVQAAAHYPYPMADETILLPPPVEPIKLKDALEERYLQYALSTIMRRALMAIHD